MSDDTGGRPERLPTDDGVMLEAAWSGPADAVSVAVLTHPHPRFGGDMHNLVPASLARSLPEAGMATLRFNFRGTGASSGTHGDGRGEIDDVRAAIGAAAAAHPGVPVVGIGYSFGADVLLATADHRLAGVVAVAPPLAVLPAEDLAAPRGGAPTLVVSAAHDQFRSPADAQAIVSGWPGTTFEVLEGADHFMAGMSDRIRDQVLAFLEPVIA